MPPEETQKMLEKLKASKNPMMLLLVTIKEDLEHLKGDVAKLQEQYGELNVAITGNSKIGVQGLVTLVNEHHSKLKRFERIFWIGTGASIALAGFWDKIKSKIFN